MGRRGQVVETSALEAAARWYVELQEAPADASRQGDWQRWHDAHPEHRQAWRRLQALEDRLGGLPSGVALSALSGAAAGRRSALKTLVLLIAAGPMAWSGYRHLPWREWSADHQTAVGERRELYLADGTHLHLNTDTALDVRYSATERLLYLHAGEIAIQTAADVQARAFRVHTAHGTVRALGTRFTVRTDAERTGVAVQEQAVEIHALDAMQAPIRLDAGQAAVFSRDGIDAPQPADAAADAWTRGMLVVLDWRLDRFVAELSRHRNGHLGCDPAVGGLHVSGAFRLDDTDGALDNVAATLPVRLQRWSRHWVRIVAR